VKVSSNMNLVIRCERLGGATRVGSSRRGTRKCQNKTRNKMVPRRSGNSRSHGWDLCRNGNRSIQCMIFGGKHRGESRKNRCANGGLASHHIPGVKIPSIWDHCIMGHLKGDSQDMVS
jgi:hypothetical protein